MRVEGQSHQYYHLLADAGTFLKIREFKGNHMHIIRLRWKLSHRFCSPLIYIRVETAPRIEAVELYR